jgi:hypothetical protein
MKVRRSDPGGGSRKSSSGVRRGEGSGLSVVIAIDPFLRKASVGIDD